MSEHFKATDFFAFACGTALAGGWANGSSVLSPDGLQRFKVRSQFLLLQTLIQRLFGSYFLRFDPLSFL